MGIRNPGKVDVPPRRHPLSIVPFVERGRQRVLERAGRALWEQLQLPPQLPDPRVQRAVQNGEPRVRAPLVDGGAGGGERQHRGADGGRAAGRRLHQRGEPRRHAGLHRVPPDAGDGSRRQALGIARWKEYPFS